MEGEGASGIASKWVKYQAFQEELPGISFVVVRNGETVLKDSMGFADIEDKEKLESNHGFHLASITKYFVSLGVLKLVDREEIRLDQEIGKVLGSVKGATIEELLGHRAGFMRNASIGEQYWETGNFPEDLSVTEFQVPEMEGRFKYSNLGYAVLGELIEKVSGLKFKEYMREEVLEPMSVEEAVFSPQEFQNELVTGYGRDGPKMAMKRFEPCETKAYTPVAGMISDLGGIEAAMKSILEDEIPVSGEIVEKRREDAGDGYSLGTRIWEIEGNSVYGHTGAFRGYTSSFGLVPEEDIGVAVMINQGDAPAKKIMKGLIQTFLRAEEIDPPLTRMPEYSGFYRSYVDGDFILQKFGEGAIIVSPDSDKPLEDYWHLEELEEGYRIRGGTGYGTRGEKMMFKVDEGLKADIDPMKFERLEKGFFSLKNLL
jgi:CubicO group peptidase (beta-lactamase class C family)